MTRLADLAALTSLTFLLATAHAQDRPVSYERTKPVAVPTPPPRLRIVSPTPKQVMTTRRFDKDVELPCVLDSKDRQITVSAEGWPVKAGGPGVLVVVDGLYATTSHDLSRPISMEMLEPMTEDKGDSQAVSPISACGWHSVAVVPTLANGQMAAVPPVLSWYYSKPTRSDDAPSRSLEDYLAKPLVVINWPLMGTFYPGESNGAQPGFTVANASKVPFDFTIAPGAKCSVRVKVRDHGDDLVLTTPGLTYIKNVPGPSAELAWELDCGDGGGLAAEGVGLYTKAPTKVAARKWPAASATIAAADRAVERAAHRLPGKRPYDGVFHGGGGNAAGDLTCPAVVKVRNNVLDVEVVLGHTMTYGTVRAKVNADGFVDPLTVKLTRAKPLPGKSAAAADYVDVVKRIGAVEVSGDFAADRSQGAHGTRLDLRLELVGQDGGKTSDYCASRYFIEGYQRIVHDCDTSDTCGTRDHLKCCSQRH